MIVWSPDVADDSAADPVEPAAGLEEDQATSGDGPGAEAE